MSVILRSVDKRKNNSCELLLFFEGQKGLFTDLLRKQCFIGYKDENIDIGLSSKILYFNCRLDNFSIGFILFYVNLSIC